MRKRAAILLSLTALAAPLLFVATAATISKARWGYFFSPPDGDDIPIVFTTVDTWRTIRPTCDAASNLTGVESGVHADVVQRLSAVSNYESHGGVGAVVARLWSTPPRGLDIAERIPEIESTIHRTVSADRWRHLIHGQCDMWKLYGLSVTGTDEAGREVMVACLSARPIEGGRMPCWILAWEKGAAGYELTHARRFYYGTLGEVVYSDFPGMMIVGAALAIAALFATLIALTATDIINRHDRRRRIRAGRCIHCAYDVRSLPASAPCPECGKPVITP